MKANIKASDGFTAVEINITVRPLKGSALERHEIEKITTVAARIIAADLRDLPLSDFGLENIRVTLNRKG